MSNYKEVKPKLNDGWCFAYVNGRLAEIYFSPDGAFGHCYIDYDEFSKNEQKMIDNDTAKYQFTYRNGCYYDQIRRLKLI